jgi:pimeloyl-ACP methyl ester carboxylesterase
VLLEIFIAILILIAAAAIAQWILARRDDRRFPAPGMMVKIHGAEMHVKQMGEGQPAVLLEAGIAASTLNWSLLQPELANLAATYSYDRAGFGWSRGKDISCSLPRIVDDLHATIAALKIASPYILVGHSFGGFIVREYAQRFPNELAGLVMIDPLTPEEWLNPTSSQRWKLRGGIWFSRAGAALASIGVIRACLWLLKRGKSRGPRAALAVFGPEATKTVSRILGELLKLPPETVELIRARWCKPDFFLTMAGYIQSIPRCSAEVYGSNVPPHIPVTVISGAHQAAERLREHAAITTQSMHGRHLIAAKGAHWVHLDQPELVVQAVRDLAALTRNPTAARN